MSIRIALISAAAMAFTAPAFAGTFTVEFANAERVSAGVVANGAIWTCDGAVCTADLSRRTATVRVCKKLEKEGGEVVSLRSENNELDAEQIAACNA